MVLKAPIQVLTLIFIIAHSSGFSQNLFHHFIQRRASCSGKQCEAPVIKSSPKNFTITIGIPKTIKCRAQGNPLPTIIWEKNNIRIDPANQHFEITTQEASSKKRSKTVVRSQLKIRDLVDRNIKYITCRASNWAGSTQSARSYVTYGTTANNIKPENVPGSSKFIDPMKQEQCLKYTNGSVCLPYLNPSRNIYSSHGLPSLQMLENTLKELSKNFQGENTHISQNCRPYALPFLCYHNFGYCEMKRGKPKKVRICKKDCEDLRMYKCYAEFEKAQEDETLRQLLPKSCDEFSNRNCISIITEMDRMRIRDERVIPSMNNPLKNGLTPFKNVYSQNVPHNPVIDPSDNCFFDRGQSYRGIRNVTEKNNPCLYWRYTKEGNVVELPSHNFCRNPGAKRDRPWCYVSGGYDRKFIEYCDIPSCSTPIRSPTTNILYTIIPCLIFALAVSLAIITLAWKRHKQHYYESTSDTPKQVVPRVSPKIQELDREDLCDFRLLGDGNIGRIYTADFTGNRDGRTVSTCVAVKAIVEKATQKQIEDFIREAETRANFKHENILSLIGVISKEEPLSLIYEYYEFGDLHEYLLRHSPNFSDAHADGDCQPLEHNDLLLVATQIASGMSYLSTHSFVHKDIAARNCIIADNGIIKITDISGISDMYAGDYYRIPGRLPMPVRWMSAESLSHSVFTTSSDAWSYGVLLWEIFSYGNRPYFGLSNYQAMQQVVNYETLSIPDGCPGNIFGIMERCWSKEPTTRPTFSEIYNQLKSLNDKLFDGSVTNSLQKNSNHSLRSSNSRDINRGGFNRNSLSSYSHNRSLHSPHSSSNQSLESSNHPASSLRSGDNLPPPSNMSFSVSMNSHIPPARRSHHSLPKDIRCMQSREGYYSHMLPLHNGHHSLPRDGHYSALPDNRLVHMGQYQHPASYISSQPSYPNSLSCPPVSVLSRQSSSRASSHAPSGKSNVRAEGYNSASGSHVYL